LYNGSGHGGVGRGPQHTLIALGRSFSGTYPHLTKSIPNPGWVLEPFAVCVEFIADEAKIGGLLKRSLVHTEQATPLLQSVDKLIRKVGARSVADAAQRLAADAPFHEEWAKELRESDYAVLNAHGLVAIWGALETCIEDTIACILLYWSRTRPVLDSLQISFPGESIDEETAHALYTRIERKLAVRGDVIGTYAAVLRVFDLEATISSDAADSLREANAVRNCLLHRGGRIDGRAIREAPALSNLEGKVIRVSSDAFVRYHAAVSDWLVSLSQSLVTSKYYPAR
jgi:hypothetical protein